MMKSRYIKQSTRFITMLVYIAILFGILQIAIGSIPPPTSEKGLWFYVGLASLLLGYILTNPFFTPPADAFTNGVAALISLLTVNIFKLDLYTSFDIAIWIIVFSLSVIVILASGSSIVLKDSTSHNGIKTGKIFYVISSRLGSPKIIFSMVYLFALIAFHRNYPHEYLWIGFAWVFLLVFQPIENVLDIIGRIKEIIKEKTSILPKFGEIVGHQFPNILLIKHDPEASIEFGTPIIVHGDDGKCGLAMSLDHIGYAEGRWLRAYKLNLNLRDATFENTSNLPIMGAFRCDIDNLSRILEQSPIWQKRGNFIGVVAPDSDVAQLRMDISNSDQDIQIGRLLEVQTKGLSVLYQVINGITKEEIIQQKNTRGYVRSDAKKIGIWNESESRFQVSNWVPQPNSPIFLINTSNEEPIKDAVGFFPGTNYPIKIDDIDKLITHNTAILGILGIGKSFLAFELVERMIAHGVKVICLDITNQYVVHLAGLFNNEKQVKAVEWLHQHIPDGRNNYQKVREEGGSILEFKKALTELLGRFLDPSNSEENFLILNPSEFEVWHQEGNMYRETDKPPMGLCTPVEITKLITEVALEILRGQGISESAKCCLVYEEAHSLIPEWNSVVNDGDKSASNGIAKAILQGRKYGLGCLVITQRTANVTKSILNQCNTVFALRIFDATEWIF